jgi:drug/metabolite transporter (DMT)-like permease
VLFKLGSGSVDLIVAKNSISLKISFFSLLGLLMYIGAFFLSLGILKTFNLSWIMPLMQAGIVLGAVICGIIFLHEKIVITQIIGIFIITVGIVLTIKRV